MNRLVPVGMTITILLFAHAPVMACEWDGGTTRIIPGVVEIERGCCENQGGIRLTFCSVPVTGDRTTTYCILGIAAACTLAGVGWGITKCVRLKLGGHST